KHANRSREKISGEVCNTNAQLCVVVDLRSSCETVLAISAKLIFASQVLRLVEFKITKVVTAASAVGKHHKILEQTKIKSEFRIHLCKIIARIIQSREVSHSCLPEYSVSWDDRIVACISREAEYSSEIGLF